MANLSKLGYSQWRPSGTGFERELPGGGYQSVGYASEQGKRLVTAFGLPQELSMTAEQRAHKMESDAFNKYQEAVFADKVRRAALEEQKTKEDIQESLKRGKPYGQFAPKRSGTAMIPDPENPARQIQVKVGEDTPGSSMEDILGMARALGYYKDEPKVSGPKKYVTGRYYNGTTNQWMEVYNDYTEKTLPNQISRKEANKNKKDFIKQLETIYEGEDYTDMEKEHDLESMEKLNEDAAGLGLKINWQHTPFEKRSLGLDILRKDRPESWRIRSIQIASNHDAYDEGGRAYASMDRQQDPTVKVTDERRKVGDRVPSNADKEPPKPKFNKDEMAKALAVAWRQLGKDTPWRQASEAEKNEARQLAETYLNKGMI